MGLRQRGQREAGEIMEISSGMRVMQTFKKLPMTMPKRKKKTGITRLTVPYTVSGLNAAVDAGCRMGKRKASP